jgi:hypothetical protein
VALNARPHDPPRADLIEHRGIVDRGRHAAGPIASRKTRFGVPVVPDVKRMLGGSVACAALSPAGSTLATALSRSASRGALSGASCCWRRNTGK